MFYTNYMNRELAKSLVKDYDLPIQFYDEPYFSYFVNLMNPYYQISDKIKLLELDLNKMSLNDFLSQYRKVSDAAILSLKESKAFQSFNEATLSLPPPPQGFMQAQRLYTSTHQDQLICSVDLVKANFSVLLAFDAQIFNAAETYEKWLGQFTESKYLQGSKKIRQVIFGNLNPKRQQTLQRHYMSWVKHYLTILGLREEEILLASSDELVFKVQEPILLAEQVKEAFNQAETKALSNFYRLNTFTLRKIHKDHDYFVKEYTNPVGKIEFKNIPQNYLPQAIRHYQNEAVTELDRKFIVDGLVATFDEELFKK
jgi:hypothetical protein